MHSNVFTKAQGEGMKIAIVVARFNTHITEGLLEGAWCALREAGVQEADAAVFRVPGSFEVPIAVKKLVDSKKYTAVIALGAIVKGETRHDEYLAQAVSHALASIAVASGVPVLFGIITANTYEQAVARSKNDKHNRGYEAAMSALEMVKTFREFS